ncbi:MAG TPA: acyltransferase [Puia sp.]|nr:acyltransferase [Puia sp.]
MTKPYYPGLSGLRAIAAFLVLFTHVEEMRQLRGMKGLVDPGFNAFLGGVAVTFFFVLSGLLITGLLLTEKKQSGTIRMKRFFINRALRIWPLYYLVLFAGYGISIFLFHETDTDIFTNGMLLGSLLLPNVAFASGLLPKILVQLWSIGPEEQFYFSWPFLIRRLRPQTLACVFIGIILFWAAAIGALRVFYGPDTWLHALLFRTRIDCMAIGGLSALLLFYHGATDGRRTAIYRLFQRRETGWVAAALFTGLLVISYHYHVSLYQLYAALSALLILRVMTRPAGWLEMPSLRYLGRISYGVYLLHPFAIYLIFSFVKGGPAVLFFLASAALTVGLAALSYRFYESRFLKRKQ